jgi:cyclic beta-1,2-glucan synthetase
MLPPDNFQEDPRPVIAHRTSPTNMGLHLLSAFAARDFGWAGTLQTVERLEASLATMRRLPKHKGHFFNWYDTEDLRVLEPAYVSSVDSGNLAGHLIVLAHACEEWTLAPGYPDPIPGIRDALLLARADLGQASHAEGHAVIARIMERLDQPEASRRWLRTCRGSRPSCRTRSIPKGTTTERTPAAGSPPSGTAIAEHLRDRGLDHGRRVLLGARLAALAAEAREMAMAMDFAFLLDPERKLLSIGYSVTRTASIRAATTSSPPKPGLPASSPSRRVMSRAGTGSGSGEPQRPSARPPR